MATKNPKNAAADKPRKYRAYWSRDFCNPGTRTLGADQFTEQFCYSPEEVAAIAALEVGQTWKSTHYGHRHTVTRVK